MSGGHYHYAYHQISDLAQEIDHDCVSYAADRVDTYGLLRHAIPPDILVHMIYISCELHRLAKAAHDIEWYMSGDYGEECLKACESWNLSQACRDSSQACQQEILARSTLSHTEGMIEETNE